MCALYRNSKPSEWPSALEDVDRHCGGFALHHAAAVLREADLGFAVLDLALTRFAAKLPVRSR